MDFVGTTLSLAAALEVPVDPGPLGRLASSVPPLLWEWSVNGPGDPRGRLRVVLWTGDGERLRAALGDLLPASIAALFEDLPAGEQDGLGLAFSAGAPPLWRWYRLAPPGAGLGLAEAAARRLPELAAARALLDDICGGPAFCAAVGVEADGGAAERPLRSTLYYSLPGPAAAQLLRERAGLPGSADSERFFQSLGRSWPKVWVGRSTGPQGGWKCYYFARGDLERPADPVLLELAGAGAATREARRRLAAACGGGDVVQLLALNFPAEGGPRWTIYLSAPFAPAKGRSSGGSAPEPETPLSRPEARRWYGVR